MSSSVQERIPVAVLGATGSVGQRFVSLLANHPWFAPVALTGSERSAGRSYREAAPWMLPEAMPTDIAEQTVLPTGATLFTPVVFSALPSSVAGPVEEAYARAGHLVVTNASSHRMDHDVPLVVPEVNPPHLELAAQQSYGAGRILANPNCSTIGLVLALKALDEAFGLERAHVVTLQAISGAGLPGPGAMQMLDNLLPFIPGEEEKLERETRKILGTLRDGAIVDAPIEVSAQCTRVPVLDGHTLCVSVGLERKASTAEVREAWHAFRGAPQELALPSAPARPVHVLDGVDAPQPRLHRHLDGGMATAVGRLRPCALFDHKFIALSHNTLRGAAGGSILLAELAVARGMLERLDSRHRHGEWNTELAH